ncbi:MAG TPA: hypothetical protein VJ201_06700 [Candidatus Babeliales bacterium]|nr:hypothetical protein [Candidatus Babeliales bacterium]
MKTYLLFTLVFFQLNLFGKQIEEIIFNKHNLGAHSISVDLFMYIIKNIPHGSSILEFGSGRGTGELARYYTIFSIENDPLWLNKYPSTYIYAPIKNYGHYQWYDFDIINKEMPSSYDLILVDGPPGHFGREGFLMNLSMFNTNVTIIVDDIQRDPERILLENVSKKLERPYEIITCSDKKKFGVINV